MQVSRKFLKDFAYLANLYGWTAADIEDVKAQTRANPEPLRAYWTGLAAAHRAGYEQNADNGFIRLAHWCQQAGVADPYGHVQARAPSIAATAKSGENE